MRLAVTCQDDVQAFIEALKSVVWVMVLVVIIVYIFAVLGQVLASLVHGAGDNDVTAYNPLVSFGSHLYLSQLPARPSFLPLGPAPHSECATAPHVGWEALAGPHPLCWASWPGAVWAV